MRSAAHAKINNSQINPISIEFINKILYIKEYSNLRTKIFQMFKNSFDRGSEAQVQGFQINQTPRLIYILTGKKKTPLKPKHHH